MNSSQRPRRDDASDRLLSQGDDLPDDPRLLQAVQEYLDELERGRRPQRPDFLRRYADIADPLARCLDGLELVHQAASGEPASRAGAKQSSALSSPDLPVDPLGDFRIVREIGRGGMGIVYEAVQLSLGRRVALKVLPFAAAFDAKQLQRFHNEAHAAAQLHHTNIVPVYAVGCERGVHFYAMQLIEGQSLAVVIQQLRQQAEHEEDETGGRRAFPPQELITNQLTTSYPPLSPPAEAMVGMETISPLSRALSTHRSQKQQEFFRAAARFIVQAAEALEHAHQFGIVHRDIKPANLLVDVHGRLWITDFGLAQFHTDAGLTQTGDIVGTLRYMSPEQASGQRVLLDHRTDIYALGATLYELATLEPIFPGQNRQELLHRIINDEPRPPRALDDTVPVELETIILKAISKSPSDRYASALDLADDLRRYLEDKPILAKRPSLVERVRKWSRRHPEWVAAGVFLLLLSVAGLLISNRMIAAEKARTAKALENEQRRAAETEKLFQQARLAVDVLVQVCEEELANAPPHLQGARKRLLELALAYHQSFLDQQQDNAAVQAELAEGRNRVERILEELSTLQDVYKQMLAVNPDVQKDLKLSQPQRDGIAQLGKRWFEQRPPNDQQRSPEAKRRHFLTIARDNDKALGEILGERQRQRLRQIALQSQGLMAFHEPRVVDALRLTPEQRQQIRAIEGSLFARMRPPGPPHPGEHHGPSKDMHMEDVQRNAVERVAALFTPEQVKRWKELTGEPFAGAFHCPPPDLFGPR
jgi:eukaryotic-like serine/threonine-protein kinase